MTLEQGDLPVALLAFVSYSGYYPDCFSLISMQNKVILQNPARIFAYVENNL